MADCQSSHVGTPGGARQVGVPSRTRALSTLSRVDYEDAFRIDTALAQDRTGEQWARAILEGAPLIVQRKLRQAWFALGLRLSGERSERFVLGWEVRRRAPGYVLLGATSRVGLPAELVFQRRQDSVLLATLVQQQNLVARAMWALVERQHRVVVPYVIERAVRRDAAASGKTAQDHFTR